MQPTANLRISLLARCAAAAVVGSVPAMALAQAAPPPQAAPVPQAAFPSVSPLSQIPGVTVRYYDVTGNTIEEIRASIAAQRPKDPATGNAVPSSSNWSLGVSVKKATTGNSCKISDATPRFQGEVVLPRLTNIDTVAAPVRAQWRTYVASLEQQQANSLRQPYQRLGEIKSAVMASSCEGAGAAANKAISEINRAASTPPAPPPVVPAPATPQQQ